MVNSLYKKVEIPAEVCLGTQDKIIRVEGPLGSTSVHVPQNVDVELSSTSVGLKVLGPSYAKSRNLRSARACLGSLETSLRQGFRGVLSGHRSQLELVGVGFRASAAKKVLTLKIGYSHDVTLPLPEFVEVSCPKPTSILFKSCSLQDLENFVSEVQAYRPPEPYKGKGILRRNQVVLRKEGKRG